MAPCRYCGRENPWHEIDAADTNNLKTFLECSNCHAMTVSYADVSKAIEDWNAGLTQRPAWAIAGG